ncbi:hypothetical protein QBC38DRAFT_453207 [Podospora fimiseda]|uniref:Uncharacterized protein n=1 Tax=Podospora fimiseda TaxID=252190 RepID=A0AAN7BU56_9PEZI|nr:hypothetical protein QBC38DRAFT_453207 [Podospora fimiseda]
MAPSQWEATNSPGNTYANGDAPTLRPAPLHITLMCDPHDPGSNQLFEGRSPELNSSTYQDHFGPNPATNITSNDNRPRSRHPGFNHLWKTRLNRRSVPGFRWKTWPKRKKSSQEQESVEDGERWQDLFVLSGTPRREPPNPEAFQNLLDNWARAEPRVSAEPPEDPVELQRQLQIIYADMRRYGIHLPDPPTYRGFNEPEEIEIPEEEREQMMNALLHQAVQNCHAEYIETFGAPPPNYCVGNIHGFNCGHF